MRAVNLATIKWPSGTGFSLSLNRIESKVYRWMRDDQPYDRTCDYLTDTSAITALRVLVEEEADFYGADLTILPIAPPAEERAAKRIYDYAVSIDGAVNPTLDEIAEIIRNETAIDKLVETGNALAVHGLQRLCLPKPAGMDLVQAGLLYSFLEALERAQAISLEGLKAQLKEPVTDIKIFSSMPKENPQ